MTVTDATASRCRSPLDRSRGCRPANAARPNRSSSAAVRTARSGAGTPLRTRPYATSSSTVSRSRWCAGFWLT